MVGTFAVVGFEGAGPVSDLFWVVCMLTILYGPINFTKFCPLWPVAISNSESTAGPRAARLAARQASTDQLICLTA
jgi:hypothetical protein